MKRWAGLLLVVLFGVTGCLDPKARLQSEEMVEEKPEVKTIGEVTSVANAQPIPVSGVGLVVDLEGTGGGLPPPSGFRSLLEHHLRKKGLNAKQVLASPDTAMVLVSAVIPPGARENDKLDVDITLPPHSKTESLNGGVLKECSLFNYESTKHLSPSYTGGNRALKGHPVARAAGPILVGFGDGDASAKQRRGRIWGGGRSNISRPFYLALNSDVRYARVAVQVSERINQTFQGSFMAPTENLAEAKTKEVVYLGVPAAYRHNVPRYLRVIRMIPIQPSAPNSAYRTRIKEELEDPAKAITAALRLEAFGTDSIPDLQRGLRHKHPLVRFASAEALAYLGEPAAGEVLAKLVKEQPALRAFGLTALASLDDQISYIMLRDLLEHPTPEVRYGAFRALTVRSDREQQYDGELLNDSFWLHQVAPNSPAMVHMSTTAKAEVVLFGEDSFLQAPFSFLAGPEFTITASADDNRCTISRFSVSRGTARRQCSLHLEEVIRTMTDLGGTYTDVVDFLRQVEECHCLTCKVAVDSLPTAVSVYEIAKSGLEGIEGNGEIILPQDDFSDTPNLFAHDSKFSRLTSAKSYDVFDDDGENK